MTTAHQIQTALRQHWPSGAYAVLEEVRSRTGYGGAERYADALVCSCWPSRGLWLAGVEIKVSRSDWQREISSPTKSAEIQRWCKYWWVAAPKGLVRDGELPETWGLLEHCPEARSKNKMVVKVQAPAMEHEPPSMAFVAAILRNVAKTAERSCAATEIRVRQELSENAVVAEAEELRNRLALAEQRLEQATRDRDCLKIAAAELVEFRQMLGVWSQSAGATTEEAIAAMRVGAALRKAKLGDVAKKLTDLAVEIAAAAEPRGEETP